MILVTGARGNVGRHVVQELIARSMAVRVLTRRPEEAGFPAGVEVVRGDLARGTGLVDAFRAVDSVFLVRVPGADGVARLARDAGVSRVVLLSSAAVELGPDNAIARTHQESEQAVLASGLSWTFLRPGAFSSNALAWAASIRSEGIVRAPFPEVATAPVDPRDVAAAAAVALSVDGHARRAYTLTGPELLTPRAQTAILGGVLGRPIAFEALTEDDARAEMAPFVPPSVAEGLMSLMRAQAHRPLGVTDSVTAITGASARSFQAWARDYANLFR